METTFQDKTDFLTQYFKSKEFTLTDINNSASARQYRRVLFKGKSYILTQSRAIKENETFLYFSEIFKKSNISAPKILSISADQSLYLQEDLGDESLLIFLQNNTETAWKPLTEKIIQDLVNLQISVHQNIDYTKGFEFQKFDEKVILNDLFYFKNYFLEYLEIPFQKGKLIDDFFSIAQQIKELPNDFFLFRDFQSRNIMIHENNPYYIDFQGGMQGIACYDLVSFSWQSKANFSTQIRTELKQVYFEEMMQKTTISVQNLEKSYQLSLILRLFQLLGAYGFRGLVQQKSHFKESIFQAIENIQYLVENNYLDNYPELLYITKKYIHNSKIKL